MPNPKFKVKVARGDMKELCGEFQDLQTAAAFIGDDIQHRIAGSIGADNLYGVNLYVITPTEPLSEHSPIGHMYIIPGDSVHPEPYTVSSLTDGKDLRKEVLQEYMLRKAEFEAMMRMCRENGMYKPETIEDFQTRAEEWLAKMNIRGMFAKDGILNRDDTLAEQYFAEKMRATVEVNGYPYQMLTSMRNLHARYMESFSDINEMNNPELVTSKFEHELTVAANNAKVLRDEYFGAAAEAHNDYKHAVDIREIIDNADKAMQPSLEKLYGGDIPSLQTVLQCGMASARFNEMLAMVPSPTKEYIDRAVADALEFAAYARITEKSNDLLVDAVNKTMEGAEERSKASMAHEREEAREALAQLPAVTERLMLNPATEPRNLAEVDVLVGYVEESDRYKDIDPDVTMAHALLNGDTVVHEMENGGTVCMMLVDHPECGQVIQTIYDFRKDEDFFVIQDDIMKTPDKQGITVEDVNYTLKGMWPMLERAAQTYNETRSIAQQMFENPGKDVEWKLPFMGDRTILAQYAPAGDEKGNPVAAFKFDGDKSWQATGLAHASVNDIQNVVEEVREMLQEESLKAYPELAVDVEQEENEQPYPDGEVVEDFNPDALDELDDVDLDEEEIE